MLSHVFRRITLVGLLIAWAIAIEVGPGGALPTNDSNSSGRIVTTVDGLKIVEASFDRARENGGLQVNINGEVSALEQEDVPPELTPLAGLDTEGPFEITAAFTANWELRSYRAEFSLPPEEDSEAERMIITASFDGDTLRHTVERGDRRREFVERPDEPFVFDPRATDVGLVAMIPALQAQFKELPTQVLGFNRRPPAEIPSPLQPLTLLPLPSVTIETRNGARMVQRLLIQSADERRRELFAPLELFYTEDGRVWAARQDLVEEDLIADAFRADLLPDDGLVILEEEDDG